MEVVTELPDWKLSKMKEALLKDNLVNYCDPMSWTRITQAMNQWPMTGKAEAFT